MTKWCKTYAEYCKSCIYSRNPIQGRKVKINCILLGKRTANCKNRVEEER